MSFTHKVEKDIAAIDISVAKNDWEAFLEKSYKQNAKRYSVPGFRKGSAPRKVIERMYGEGVFVEDAIDEAFRKNFVEFLEKNKDIVPVSRPNIEKVDWPESENAFVTFKVKLFLRPTVTLGDYKGIKIDKVEYTVKASDVEKEVKALQEQAVRIVEVEGRAIKNGDTIVLDYSGAVDGVKFEGGTAEKQTLEVGSKSFIPGFEEQLVGLKKGDKKDITVSFPKDYHAENLKGKEAVFSVLIHSISEKQLPEVTDALIADRTKFENLKDYKEDIKARLIKEASERGKKETRDNILAAVIKNARVDIHDCMVEEELEGMLEEFSLRVEQAYRGIKIDDYFNAIGKTKEDYKKDNLEAAKKTVRTRLIVSEIVKKEKISVKKEDIETELNDIFKKEKLETKEAQDEFRKGLKEQDYNMLANSILVDKLFNFLQKNNIIEKKGDSKK